MQRITYREALAYIYSFTDYEQRGFAAYAPEFYDLDRVRRLLALLGDPQRSFQAVHVAGTKGKGSTAAMIESILRATGVRTGLYTSPHLHTFRERIQAGGEMISESDLVRLVEETRHLVAQVPSVTTFEVMTSLALAWYAEQDVAWVVLEVGLGGRLDATNVVTPAVAVITSISYDHMAVLGDTLAQIAAEKAGIVKTGVPVVSAPQTGEALAVIEATCRQRSAPLTLVGRDWTWEAGQSDLDSQTFGIQGSEERFEALEIPLLGEHQLVNATTAVATVSLLQTSGLSVSQEAIRAGLERLYWPGRLEILGQAPLVVADSAHNGDSAQKLVAALKANLAFRHLILILGASPDHATPELMKALLTPAHRSIVTQSRHPRAAEPTRLQALAEALGFHVEVAATVPEALDMAMSSADSEDLICCTGSVFVAAEARAAWFSRLSMPVPPSDPS
jgi:dihydrofolate synthase/folylpolyglutamate synthase